MFANVLVGVDGRQGGRDAVALALKLAAPEARLTLAHIYGNWLVGRGASLALPARRKQSAALLARERELAGVVAALVSFGDILAARGLRELAERQRAHLLVVGSSRRGKIGHVLMGDDSRAALNGAKCAVAIAPRGYADSGRTIGCIGVGYDSSPESEIALAAARELADRYDCPLKARWVVCLPEVEREAPLPADWGFAADRLRDKHLRRLRDLTNVEGEVTVGGASEELAQFAQDLDLLAVGSRGKGAIDRLLHGSVSSYLVWNVPCPLLVLPRGAHIDAGSTKATAGAT